MIDIFYIGDPQLKRLLLYSIKLTDKTNKGDAPI